MPSDPAPVPSPRQTISLGDNADARFEAITLQPGPHIAGASCILPIIRALASTGRELSGRQITKLGEDMQAALAATGASAEAAQRAAAAVTAVAAAVTRNEKRWYHIGS